MASTETATEKKEKELVKTMKSLDKHMKTLAGFYEPQRFLWMGFLRGIVYGLGILVSIAIVAPILLAILGTFDWIPFLGDIVTEIIQRMENARY